MKTLNLSRWALEHKSFVVYLMLLVALAGISAAANGGRTAGRPDGRTAKTAGRPDGTGACQRDFDRVGARCRIGNGRNLFTTPSSVRSGLTPFYDNLDLRLRFFFESCLGDVEDNRPCHLVVPGSGPPVPAFTVDLLL